MAAPMFHRRCGQRITLVHNNRTAIRNFSEFNYGLVLSSQPLLDDQLFEVRIEKKIIPWIGSIEIGVTVCDPETMDLPACATDLGHGTWMMSGNSILKDGLSLVEIYGCNLDSLVEGDCLGVMRTSKVRIENLTELSKPFYLANEPFVDNLNTTSSFGSELVFYINGEPQGIAAVNIPPCVFAVVDLYGKFAQVSIIQGLTDTNLEPEASNPTYFSTITNIVPNISSERSTGSREESDAHTEGNICHGNIGHWDASHIMRPLPHPQITPDRLRFHSRCGSLVKLSCNGRTAERTRPLEEFNDGVVMTNRILHPDELFEIRIDRLVDKWSGSIEVGVTTHNPATLQFPATMTHMCSGTTMMSGSGILTNGKGTRRKYGEFNLDEIREGDRIGMMRKSNGDLHFYIYGLDQGVAASNVPASIWGVVDLYGMTFKVTIVNRDEREEQNLITRRNTSLRDQQTLFALNDLPEEDDTDRLQFHPRCGTHAAVINNNRTAHRPNALEDFNNGVVLTSRPLRVSELFEVYLDKMVTKWVGSIEIGVTTHSPIELEYPATMTHIRSGTWMMTGKGVMQNGVTVIDEYGMNLDILQVGDRVGVMRNESGTLHFFVNGVDQGEASTNVPERVYGVIDLYGQVSQATIVDLDCSPDTAHSSLSNTTWPYSDLRFYPVHGRNARISNNGLTACRPRAYCEFSEAIVICNRPLRDGELFEVVIERMVDRWAGSIEAGVTAIRPDELEFPSTMTEIDHDTWMLSGSALMSDGITVRNMYSCDLDTLATGTRIGMMWHANGSLHYYVDGIDHGPAFDNLPQHVYPVIDLYGQCAQVSVVSNLEGGSGTLALPCLSENSCSQQAHHAQVSQQFRQQVEQQSVENQQPETHVLHRFHLLSGKNIVLSSDNTAAVRPGRTYNHGIVFGSSPIHINELFEVRVTALALHWAGSLAIGVTTFPVEGARSGKLPECISAIEPDTWFLTGNEVRKNGTVLMVNYCHSLDWLAVGNRVGVKRLSDNSIHFFLNGIDMGTAVVCSPKPFENIFPVLDLYGSVAAVEVTSCSVPAAPLAMITDITATSAPIRLASGESALGSPTDDQVGDDYSQHSSRLHDSLENIFFEQRRSSEVSEAKVLETTEEPPSENCLVSYRGSLLTQSSETQEDAMSMELSEIHGCNVVLGEGRRSAKRSASYNQALVFTARPVTTNQVLQIRIERLNTRWVSSVMFGVTSQLPEQAASLPLTALGLRHGSFVLSGDSVYRNGTKVSDFLTSLRICSENLTVRVEVINEIKGRRLFNLDCILTGAVLGMRLDMNGLLFVSVNGVDVSMVTTDLRPTVHNCYFIIDLYGQCEEVSILGGTSSLERNIAANNSTNAAIQASAIESMSVPQPDSLGEKADLETHEKDSTIISSPENTPLQDDNIPNQNDIANMNVIHQSSFTSSAGLSNCSSFFLLEGLCSQSSNNLGPNSFLGSGTVAPSVVSVVGPNVSGLNLSPNCNSSSTSHFMCSFSNVNDASNSTPLQNNRVIHSIGSMPTASSAPASPATPVITPTQTFKNNTNCGSLQACGRFKKLIGLPDGFFSRDGKMCYCLRCTPQEVGGEAFLQKGDPPMRYSIPFGWCRFPLRRRCGGEMHENWHVAYHGARVSNLRRILDRGELLMQDNLGLTGTAGINTKSKDDDTDSAGSPLVLSPFIKYASATASKYEFVDPKTHSKLLVHVAFQVLVRPGSYKIRSPTVAGVAHPVDPHLEHDSSEWVTKERGATVLQALLLCLEGLD